MSGNESNGKIPEGDWAALISKARAGDRQAIGTLCDQLREGLLLKADRGIGGDLRAKLSASDIVQQSMLEAHKVFPKFDGSTVAELRSWLEQILHNNVIDAARRYRGTQQRDVSLERPIEGELAEQLADEHDSPSFNLRQHEADAELLSAVENLPETRRKVIQMRHRDELSYAQIAEVLSMSEEAVRKHWSRAVDQLRKILDRDKS